MIVFLEYEIIKNLHREFEVTRKKIRLTQLSIL